MVNKIFYLVLVILFLCAPLAQADDQFVECAGDIQAAVDATSDGDTVTIGSCPAGVNISTYIHVGTASVDKNITITGTGDLETVLNYRILNSAPSNQRSMFAVYASGTTLSRITNIRINSTINYATTQGIIGMHGGNSTNCNVRVDHMYFDNFKNWPVYTAEQICMLVDHNIFRGGSQSAVHVGAAALYPQSVASTNGNGSGAHAQDLGGIVAVYFETNDVEFTDPNAASVIDGELGARAVARFNRMKNANCNVHGTEGGLQRGAIKTECYANDMSETTVNGTRLFHWRSGTGVGFLNIGSEDNNTLGAVTTYRTDHDYGPNSSTGQFRKCTGLPTLGPGGVSVDKITPGGPFWAGQATAVGTGGSMTDSNQNWTTDEWIGYSVLNTTTPFGTGTVCGVLGNSCSTIIKGNNATTLTLALDHVVAGSSTTFAIDDGYEIWKAEECLDQTGVSAGEFYTISGGVPTFSGGTKGWPNQVRTPGYFWLNTANGHALASVFTQSPNIRENYHFYNQAGGWYDPQGYPDYDLEGLNGISRCPNDFDGTCGIGVGTKAEMEAFTTCAQYTAFWVQNEGSWNSGGNPALDFNYTGQGLLYQCNPANTWTLYYTPFDYPYPGIGTEPSLSSIDPDEGGVDSVVPVTLFGANLDGATPSITISGANVTGGSIVVVSESEVTANVTILTAAALGARNLTFTTAEGTSNAVTFTIVCVPEFLDFGTQPASALLGASLGTVTVTVEDAGGNTCTDSTLSVSMAKSGGSPAGTLNGTLTKSAVAGVATFNDMSITVTGGVYQLVASGSGVTSDTSSTFTITAPATSGGGAMIR